MRMPFRHVLLTAILSLTSILSFGQWMVFKSNGYMVGERVLYKTNGRILIGDLYAPPKVLFTVIGNEIMAGGSGSTFDLLYTYREGKLYFGNAMYSGQIAYTFENGRVYRGNSNFPMDVVCTIERNAIYKGAYANIAEAQFLIDGGASIADLFAILLALGMIE